jgi:hypothetical protein
MSTEASYMTAQDVMAYKAIKTSERMEGLRGELDTLIKSGLLAKLCKECQRLNGMYSDCCDKLDK